AILATGAPTRAWGEPSHAGPARAGAFAPYTRRFDLKQMLPRLAAALLRRTPCPERVLRMASNFHG
ncbi:hypothetical protein BXO582_19310, partial [Xanthomonas oryzae pv. oryzae]